MQLMCPRPANRFVLYCLVVLAIGCWRTADAQLTLTDSLQQELRNSQADTQRVHLLNDIAWEYKVEQADSAIHFLNESIRLSQELSFTKGEAQAYNNRGVVETIRGNYELATEFYQKAIVLRKELGDRKGLASLYNNIGNLQEELGNYPVALENLRQSLFIREELKDSLRIARVSYNIAVVLESMGDYIEAMDYALNHLSLAERQKDSYEIANAHNLLGNLKTELERFDEAARHYQTALDIRIELGDEWELGQAYLNSGNILDQLAEENYKDERFAEAAGQFVAAKNHYLKSLQLHRKMEDSSGIGSVYNNLGVLYKNWGSYYDDIEQKDSAQISFEQALAYLDKAMQIRKKTDDQKGIMETYNGLGDVKRRQDLFEEALDHTYDYLDIAQQLNDQKYIQKAYKDLSRVYADMDKYKKAYKFRKKYDELRYDRLSELRASQNAHREAIYGDTRKQIELERKGREIQLQEAKLEQEALWRKTLIGGAIGLLLLAMLLYNRYRIKSKANVEMAQKNEIIERERERSESLLLNILPAETARELKEHGKTTARHYESVSVLFTDFRSFTEIAEAMEPAELVAELDECFRAFDAITERYGIEKIKTIGDSYMCVAGLPNEMPDHARRLTEAALEMQVYMLRHRETRVRKDQPYFESRIGIHSGPVVAGVVGSRKFAYDIWGDTVNLASRMESNGAVGKVNISRATFELIKGQFDCDHRGKLPVKNKGEVDMYFVKGLKSGKFTDRKVKTYPQTIS